MSANDSKRSGQPEAASGKLGGEEGIEDAGKGVFAHPATRVADLQAAIPARRQRGACLVQLPDARGHRDSSWLALTNRFRGVDHQIHHKLMDLAGVGPDWNRREIETNLHAVRQRRAHQGNGLVDQSGDLDILNQEASLAGICEELPRKVRRAAAGGHHSLQQWTGGIGFGEPVQRKTRVAHDSRQQVIEIVRNPTGEQSQAFESLRVTKL
jgi:hypothetical protein